ncbi:MAG: helix-turn-helix transcriptional regulator [Novosphingobium sp.]
MTTRLRQITQRRDRQTLLVAAVVAVQAVAAVFFVGDALGDFMADGITAHIAIEAVIAFALMSGVFVGAAHLRRLLAEADRREAALAVARGAISEHIAARFADWGLTAAESDVALFAIKGCDVAEIAALRSAAHGTVRAQLSQIYAKAGVTSQAGLVSLFLEDLL